MRALTATMKAVLSVISVVWISLLFCCIPTPAFPFQIRSSHSAHLPRLLDFLSQDTGRSLLTQVAVARTEKTVDPSDIMSPVEVSAPFNFGPASSRDCILYTCHCPGYTGKEERILIAEQKQRIESWMDFMKQEQGITQVIALLDDNELILPNGEVNNEEASLDIRDVYTNAQLPFLIQPMRDVNAYRNVMECIETVADQGGKVVVHCTGGVGRAGRVASGWMVHR
jgi:hypothetical protein